MDIEDIITILVINGVQVYDVNSKEYWILHDFVDDMCCEEFLTMYLAEYGYQISYNSFSDEWVVSQIKI